MLWWKKERKEKRRDISERIKEKKERKKKVYLLQSVSLKGKTAYDVERVASRNKIPNIFTGLA